MSSVSASSTKPRSPFDIAADILNPPNDSWKAHPHQIPPIGFWFIWIMLGGRGAGKTAAAARHFYEHIMGPPCVPGIPGGHWPGIIGPTLGDAVTSCVKGPSGIVLHDPKVKVTQTAGGTMARFSNGVEAKVFGAHTPEDVERLRSGGNRCIWWAEELAAWRYMEECWQHMRYGLRVGPWPHIVASTTPKNRPLIKDLVKQAQAAENDPDSIPERERVVLTRATTDDNPDLPEHIRKMLYADYGGTRLGQQELYAKILEDVEGALFKEMWVERAKIKWNMAPTSYDRIVIGVDPSVTTTGDETGIIAAGRIRDMKKIHIPDLKNLDVPHGFVLGDYSLQASPRDWAQEVVDGFREFFADSVVAETNNGKELVVVNLRVVDPTLPVIEVHASRGKAKRAEPISTMYEQARIHHVGDYPRLENEMYEWNKDDPDPAWSPNRMDAMVWAMTHLLVAQQQSRKTRSRDTRLRGRR